MVEVNVVLLKKGIFGLHIVQAVWTVILLGVLISSLLQDGPASSSATYMFTMVCLSRSRWNGEFFDEGTDWGFCDSVGS